LTILFAGQFVPLDLMPPVIQQIAQYLPFQLLRYFPIQLILGRMETPQILLNYGLSIVWLVIAFVLFRLVWRNGIKQFSAVGA
jgi:ABC-2 type transport system permease protein